MPESLKAIIEVAAGVLPGDPLTEVTRRWEWTSSEQDALLRHETWAELKYIDIQGASREYAASLENPQRFNWVTRAWVWL